MKRILSSVIAACLFFSAFSQIPNAGFENWTNGNCVLNSYKTPDDWGTINSLTCILGAFVVEQTTDAHGGSYAIKLITKNIAGNQAPALAVTGTINTSLMITQGGFVFSGRPDKLTGWYKYAPVNNDTLSISCVLWRWVGGVYELVAEAEFESPTAVSSYTMFDAVFSYSSSAPPDSAKIELISSNTQATSQVNSTLIVDDLAFVNCNGLSVSLSTTDVTYVGNADGSATATPTGGTPPYNYYWSPSAQTTQTITSLAPGTYCVTVSDASGCTATTACETVSEPDCSGFSVWVTTTDATTTGGTDGTATVHITGATGFHNISWNTGDTSITITGLASGTYCVSVTDGVGCSGSACEVVSDPSCAGFSISLTKSDVTTVGGSDGSITAAVDSGTAPYVFLWHDGVTTQNRLNIPAGNYCVTVTDNAACQEIECIDVFEPSCSGFSVSATSTDPTTVGGIDGTASATAFGGTAPYSYAWSNSDTSQILTELPEGLYCVTATDVSGCTADTCVTLADPDCSGFSVDVLVEYVTSGVANDAKATAIPIGGTSPIEYEWSNGETTEEIIGLPPGNYCVTVTDAVGCTATDCDSVIAGPDGIIDLEEAGIKLFPNPAKDAVTIELEKATDYRLLLFDLKGKVMVEKILNTKSSVISLADFPSGNYLLELKNLSAGTIVAGKLTKE